MMKKKYTIGVMIGNAISPHIVEVIQGICYAARSMQIDVFFFLEFTADTIITSAKEKILTGILTISSMSSMIIRHLQVLTL